MARKSWFSRQPRWAQQLFNKARAFYSPRVSREKVREIVQAPARAFKVEGKQGALKGDRSKHPLVISERQLRVKRSGLTPEAQAAGAVRGEATYKHGEKGRIAADRQRETKLSKLFATDAEAAEQRAKAGRLDFLDGYHGRYRATEKGRRAYEDNREKWLRGEYLDWSERHNLSDYAIATNDPIVRILRTSPKTRPAAIAAAA
jgi:hypothetical protein